MAEQDDTTQLLIAGPPRIESLRVKNYRALKDMQLSGLTPLTVLLGPNGSGKSTVFDVFAFLSDCFTIGLRRALDARGRMRELRTKGAEGPIEFEIKYREIPYKKGEQRSHVITYHLSINDTSKGPVISEEWLHWSKSEGAGRPFRFLELENGKGTAVMGEVPETEETRMPVELASSDLLGVNTLGQFKEHPRVAALRAFITGWYLSYLSPNSARTATEAGPQERLSRTGSNLLNVIQYLKETYPEIWQNIVERLVSRVPQLESIIEEMMADGRLGLWIKDAPFKEPILAQFSSDGTLKMLAYLIVLNDPEPPSLIGLEEPENHLHPRLLAGLAEECREAAAHSQLMVTTHSPEFINHISDKELFILSRDEHGFTRAKKACDMHGIREFVDSGALLGDLWTENQFEFGDPLTEAQPSRRSR